MMVMVAILLGDKLFLECTTEMCILPLCRRPRVRRPTVKKPRKVARHVECETEAQMRRKVASRN